MQVRILSAPPLSSNRIDMVNVESILFDAGLAQRIEQHGPNVKAAGLNPASGTIAGA